jgi:photosystem II stability/assembly factor-like uncharacterized protein
MMHKFLILFILVSLPCFAQWTRVDIPTNASFRALKSREQHVWVSGTQGTVGHSADAGKTWEFQQIPQAEKLDFRDLAILNDQEVMLMSAGPSEDGKARIYQTVDGGRHWEIIFQLNEVGYFFDCLQWDEKNKRAWLLSDPINQLMTLFSYAKKKFEKLDSAHMPLLQNKEAFFAASGSSMIISENNIHLVGGGADSIRIYTYNTQKNSWKINKPGIPSGEATGYFSMGAKNKKELWAVGGDYRKLDELKIPLIRTKDSGNHWEAIPNTPAFYMEKVIWAKPYWLVSGPSQSAAYHEKTKQWRSLGKSSFHNIIQVGDRIWGIGAKGQLAYISLSSIKHLFLSKE